MVETRGRCFNRVCALSKVKEKLKLELTFDMEREVRLLE